MEEFLDKFKPENLLPKVRGLLLSGSKGPVKALHLGTGNLYGGIEKTLVTIQRFQNLTPEVEQSFALLFSGRLRNELFAENATIHMLGTVRMRYPWQVLRARILLGQIIHDKKIDWVITHSLWTHALFASKVRACGAKVGFWVHDAISDPAKKRTWVEFMAKKSPPDLLIANSKFTGETTRWLYPDLQPNIIYPLTQIPSNPDFDLLSNKVRQVLGCPEKRRVVLISSRFEAYKGHQMLIDALGALGHEGDWECWIAGEPQSRAEKQYVEELKRKATKLEIAGRLRWIGHQKDIVEFYAAADLFCQPNQGPEPFGQVFLEAQGMGCPVITFGMGGAVEALLMDGKNIILKPNDFDGLVLALRQSLIGKRLEPT